MVTVLDSSFKSNLHDYWYLTFICNIKICLYKRVNIVHLKITFIKDSRYNFRTPSLPLHMSQYMHFAQSIPECDLKLEILANSFYPGMAMPLLKPGPSFGTNKVSLAKRYLDITSWILASCLIFYTIELTLHLPQWETHTAKKWHLVSSTYTNPFTWEWKDNGFCARHCQPRLMPVL